MTRNSQVISKFIHRKIDESTDSDHMRFGLSDVKDTLAASAIDLEDAKLWEELCEGNPRVWTADRFASFKQLVYKRRYRMYKQMYEVLEWDEWKESINEK